jgi:arsenate reductase (thioredoxin)
MYRILLFLSFIILFSCQSPENGNIQDDPNASKNELTMPLFPILQQYADSLTFEFEQIPEERRNELKHLAHYIQKQRDSGQTVRLTFICTHNSRRSHMGQIWAAAAAAFYGIAGIETYSGGTETTAFNPRAVAALERAGFLIENPGGENPRYLVHLKEGDAGLRCFSKKYNDPSNPSKDFAAVMTCSQADAECPFIPGASFRIPLPYNDPKEADNTPEEQSRYDERVRQIGREMMYVFAML